MRGATVARLQGARIAVGRARAPCALRTPSTNRAIRRRAPVAAASPDNNSPAATKEEEPKETYDVYVSEPRLLDEGERKHTISVFVADEQGLINRVAGVIARRGANIESLAVGLNLDKALFTIVTTGSDSVVENLCRQIRKLVKVRYVEDITDRERVTRELLMVKVAVTGMQQKQEMLHLIDVFRGHVVDYTTSAVTVCVTGDPGKCLAFQKAVSGLGLTEVARTGQISLKRGDQLLEMGGWGEEENDPELGGGSARKQPKDVKQTEKDKIDIYEGPAGGDELGVASKARNILDTAYDAEGAAKAHTLSILVQDVPGVLNQVTGVIARRAFNVQSLAVGHAETPGLSRITCVVPATAMVGVSNLIKQLEKLVFVEQITDLTDAPYTSRELMLCKVKCAPNQRVELRELTEIFRGSIVDVGPTTITMELAGRETKMRALQELLEPYGILEVARTGRVALVRESGVDSGYLSRRSAGKVML
ncbi:unnamed protein product [Pedinophyceae sp. YPF-701]|nr:unnamed protein product [Pedinophyceae sp. YPF-701]